MNQLTEIKTALSGRVQRFVCDVVEQTDDHAVVIYRLRSAYNLHGVPLPQGTISVGYFWKDRAYNLYHWLSPEGKTLAHYFNIGDVTRYEGAELEWRDLVIDVLVTPDSRVQVLDEDELPVDIDPTLRHHIESARDEVLHHLGDLVRDSEHDSHAALARMGLIGPPAPF